MFAPTEYTLRAGATPKSVPAVREHTKSRLKSHFILSKSVGFPSPGGAIQSIDRSGLPITRGHEVGKHLSTSVSHPHFEMACTLYYIRNVQVRRSSAIADTGHAADALTRTHFRHASLNNGINRPWRVINCRCPPDMTVYSFVRRANVPNIYGIPSVGLGLKSDPVFSTCFTHTRVRTRVDNPSV